MLMVKNLPLRTHRQIRLGSKGFKRQHQVRIKRYISIGVGSIPISPKTVLTAGEYRRLGFVSFPKCVRGIRNSLKLGATAMFTAIIAGGQLKAFKLVIPCFVDRRDRPSQSSGRYGHTHRKYQEI